MSRALISVVKDAIDLYTRRQSSEEETRRLSRELDEKVNIMTDSQRRAYEALKAIAEEEVEPPRASRVGTKPPQA